MGREAECLCNWNGTAAQVKALLEPPDLILRGGIRRRLPFAKIERLAADGELLRFVFAGEKVSLALGAALAKKWKKTILAPPPSLAKKLGITTDTVVRTIGHMDAAELTEALAAGAGVSASDGDLILARVNMPAELTRALRAAAPQLDRGVPIWLVYPKGPGHQINENDVRSAGLAAGVVDTKVASVSPVLTGLRFVKRRPPREPLGRP